MAKAQFEVTWNTTNYNEEYWDEGIPKGNDKEQAEQFGKFAAGVIFDDGLTSHFLEIIRRAREKHFVVDYDFELKPGKLSIFVDVDMQEKEARDFFWHLHVCLQKLFPHQEFPIYRYFRVEIPLWWGLPGETICRHHWIHSSFMSAGTKIKEIFKCTKCGGSAVKTVPELKD